MVQGVESRILTPGCTWTEPLTGMEFVWIPPGSFWMGATEADKEFSGEWELGELYWTRELPRHEVHISQGFWVGKYPVTQGQWVKIMRENPSYFQQGRALGIVINHFGNWGNHPVEQVSWADCQNFF